MALVFAAALIGVTGSSAGTAGAPHSAPVLSAHAAPLQPPLSVPYHSKDGYSLTPPSGWYPRPDVKAALESAIRRRAARGGVFSMNDLRSEVDVSGPVVGAVFGQLSRAGVIEHVGYEHSTKANTKAHDIKTWRAAA